MAENKALAKELEEIKAQVAASKVTSLFDNAEEIGGVKIASAYFTGTTGDTLRGMCDTIRDSAKLLLWLFWWASLTTRSPWPLP